MEKRAGYNDMWLGQELFIFGFCPFYVFEISFYFITYLNYKQTVLTNSKISPIIIENYLTN